MTIYSHWLTLGAAFALLIRLPAQAETALLKQNTGQPQTTLLNIAEALTPEDDRLDDGSLYDVHLFEGRMNQAVRIALSSKDFDVFLSLENAFGEEIGSDNDSPVDTNAEIIIRLPYTGQYRILANAFDSQGEGTYQLTVDTLSEGEIQELGLAEPDADSEVDANPEVLEAIATLTEQITTYQAAQDLASEGAAQIQLGILQLQQQDYAAANASQQRALEIGRELGDISLEAWALNNIGYVYQAQGEVERAIEYYTEGLRQLEASPLPGAEVQILSNLNRIYFNQGRGEDTIRVSERLIELGEAIDSKDAAFSGWVGLFAVHKFNQASEVATNAADEITLLLAEATNAELTVTVAKELLDFYATQQNAQQAVAITKIGLDAARAAENVEKEVVFLRSLGPNQQALGNYAEAVAAMNELLPLIEGTEGPEAFALTLLGNIYNEQENHEAALEAAQKALAIARDIENPELIARSLSTIAGAYFSLGFFSESIEAAETSLAIVQDLEGLEDVLYATWLWLAAAHAELGDYESFLEISQRSGRLIDENRNPLLVQTVTTMDAVMNGVYLLSQNRLQEMVDSLNGVGQNLFLDTLTDFNSNRFNSVVQLLLSMGYSGLGQYELGLETADLALSLTQDAQFEEGQESAFFVKGELYRNAGDLELAREHYQKSLSIENSSHAQAGLARTYRDLGLESTAISHYKQAVNAIEETRENISGLDAGLQSSFLQAIADFNGGRVSDIYRELADLLLLQGRVPEAQKVLNRLKVEEINEFKNNTRATWENGELLYNDAEQAIVDAHGSLIGFGKKVNDCRQARCDALSDLRAEQRSLISQYDTQVQDFESTVDSNDRDDDLFQSPDSLSDDAAKLLAANPDAILIYPLVTEDRLWLLWAVAGGTVGSVEVDITQAQLAKEVQQLGSLLASPTNLSALQATSQTLYSSIIAPLEKELENNEIQQLIFVNDRVTRYIPMAALHDGSQYLLERYTISTVIAPDITDTQETLASTGEPEVLGLGLTQASTGRSALPAVAKELDSIVRSNEADPIGIYPGQVLLDNDFTLQAM
ncbi:MAG: tetratricopeptide repeat protein, partial [Cyanobacteria bacterium J06649_5]